MERLVIIFGMAVVYIIITTVVGSWSVKHTKDTSSFMTGKGQMGTWIIGILMMSEFIGTGSTLGTAQAAYEKGISAAWNVISLGIGFLLCAYFMAPKYNSLKEYTVSGALAQKYGSGIRVGVSLTMIFALTTVNVSMYTGGAATLAMLLQISIETAILIIGSATVVNVALGGIRGVGYANLIHTTFKYLGLIVIALTAYYLLKEKPEVAAMIPESHYSYTGVGVGTMIAWTIANIGSVFATQQVIQSVCTLPSPAAARKAAIIAAITIVPIGFFAAYIGVAAKALYPNIKSVLALPAFLNAMNPWLAGIAVAGIIAATFVSILAAQLGTTALIMKDFYIPWMKPTEERKIFVTRIITVLVGLLPIPFALFVPGLLKTIFLARALRTSVAVIAIIMFYLPQLGSSKSATIGLILSVVGTIGWFFMGNPWGIDNIYVAATIPVLVMIVDRLFFSKSGQEPKVGDKA